MLAVGSQSAGQSYQLYLWQIIRRNDATTRFSRLMVEILYTSFDCVLFIFWHYKKACGGFGNMIEGYKKEYGASCVVLGLPIKGTYTFSEMQKWLESIGLNDASASS